LAYFNHIYHGINIQIIFTRSCKLKEDKRQSILHINQSFDFYICKNQIIIDDDLNFNFKIGCKKSIINKTEYISIRQLSKYKFRTRIEKYFERGFKFILTDVALLYIGIFFDISQTNKFFDKYNKLIKQLNSYDIPEVCYHFYAIEVKNIILYHYNNMCNAINKNNKMCQVCIDKQNYNPINSYKKPTHKIHCNCNCECIKYMEYYYNLKNTLEDNNIFEIMDIYFE
jgi:hypothetical protein